MKPLRGGGVLANCRRALPAKVVEHHEATGVDVEQHFHEIDARGWSQGSCAALKSLELRRADAQSGPPAQVELTRVSLAAKLRRNAPALHFDAHDRLPVARQDIDLAELARDATSQDRETLRSQVARGDFLAERAELGIGGRIDPHENRGGETCDEAANEGAHDAMRRRALAPS
jgi:hypothetical protein